MPETINDSTPKPKGVIPKQAQGYLIGGIVLVLSLVIMFSGGSSDKKKQENVATPEEKGQVSQVSDAKVQQLQRQLQQQQELIRRQYELLKSTHGKTQPTQGVAVHQSGTASIIPDTNDEITKDIQKKEYLSLFSSNVAKTYRPAEAGQTDKEDANFKEFLKSYMGDNQKSPSAELASPTVPEPSERDNQPGNPDLNRLLATFTGQSQTRRPAQAGPAGAKKLNYDFNQSSGKKYRLFSGTILETVLMNRLNGTFTGPVSCMLTTPVYSLNRQHLLLPKGCLVLGQAKKVQQWGQERLAVSFHRLIFPDGYSINLDQFQGLSQIGATGLKDKVNHHYFQIFGASIALGLISGWAQGSVNYSQYGGNDAYRSGLADSLSQSSLRILDRFLNIMPDVIIREGHRVKVYISSDIQLPDYNNHKIPNNI